MQSTRTQTFRSIAAQINSGANVALHGPHGVGKSFMVSGLGRSGLLEREHLKVDMSVCASGAEVLCLVAENSGQCGSNAKPEAHSLVAQTVHEYWLQLRNLRNITLILDEFDQVVQFPDAREFLSHLRELVHRPQSGVNVLISSRRPLALIEEEVVGISTLAGLCAAHYLMVVDSADLVEWFGFSNQAERPPDPVDTWTCGLPSLITSWVQNGCNAHMLPEQAIMQITALDLVLDYLDQISLLVPCGLSLLGMGESVSLKQRRILQVLRLLPERETRTPQSSLGESAYFLTAIQFRLLALPPWDLTEAALSSLRSFVDQIMTETSGPHWLPKEDSKLVRPTHSAVLTATAAELWRIIQSNWPAFHSYLGGRSSTYWESSVDLLARLARQPLTYASAIDLPFGAAEAKRRLEEMTGLQNLPNGRLLEEIGLQSSAASTFFFQKGSTAVMIGENSGAINSGNAGAIVTGSGSISGGSFQGAAESHVNEPPPAIDLDLLAMQLDALRAAMRESAHTLDQDTVVVQVGQARAALESGDVGATRTLLSRAGVWVGEIASKVGADLVLKLING